MKIRIGYVSNSSASSFVLFGYKVEKPLKPDIKYMASGDYLCNGLDIFPLTPEMIELINTDKVTGNIRIYSSISYIVGDEWSGGSLIPQADRYLLGSRIVSDPNLEVIFGKKDNWSTYALSEFKERYCNEE